MADTWGSLVLHVQEYSRPSAQINLSEKPLIPDPAASTAIPQSVLMGTGRARRRRNISGWATKEDFDSLETDKESYTNRIVTFADAYTMTALIEQLDGALKIGSDLVFYSAVFVEK